MEYRKLSPPPSYADVQQQPGPGPNAGWNVQPSAPPAPPAQSAPVIIQNQQHYSFAPQPMVVQNTVVVDRTGMICPHCHASVRLRVEHHATCNTYLLAGLLCLFLCWPCVCVPCCCNCCYKTSQFCPNCNACLGSF